MSTANHELKLLLTAALILFAACDRKRSQAVFVDPPNAKSAKDLDTEDTDSEVSAVEVPDVGTTTLKFPRPSGKLLRFATEATVRLGTEQFDGSGVIIHREDDELFILTVAHAAEEGIDRVELFNSESFPEPKLSLRNPKVISSSPRLDLALLKVKIASDVETTAVKLANLDIEPRFGYSVGCGKGDPPTPLSEQITGTKTARVKNQIRKMWTTKVGQEGGRSGGPLLSDKGALLGVALGKDGSVGYYCHLTEISGYLIDNNLKSLVP